MEELVVMVVTRLVLEELLARPPLPLVVVQAAPQEVAELGREHVGRDGRLLHDLAHGQRQREQAEPVGRLGGVRQHY